MEENVKQQLDQLGNIIDEIIEKHGGIDLTAVK